MIDKNALFRCLIFLLDLLSKGERAEPDPAGESGGGARTHRVRDPALAGSDGAEGEEKVLVRRPHATISMAVICL